MLMESDAVLALDPYLRGLRSAERARRALAALDVSRNRLQRCQTGERVPDELVDRLTAARRKSERTLAHDAEALDDVMTLVFDIEKLQDPACGADSPQDRALRLIAGQRNGRPQ